MQTPLLLLTLVLLSGTLARAGLGETDAQLEARYGPSEGGPRPGVGCYWKMYSSASIRRLVVIFIDGKSEYEEYRAKDRFSAADVKAMLDPSARDGARWYRSYEVESESGEENNELSLLTYTSDVAKKEIASGFTSKSVVRVTSAKYERLHLHGGNYSWPAERLNVAESPSQ